MKKKFILLFALLNMFPWRGAFAQEIIFSKETFVDGEMSLPYRKASIQGEGDKASLVIYLHGGSSKGDDNETQMQEPGINDIGRWLVANRRKSVMVVPQCPKDKSWLGVTQNTIVAMLQTFIDRGVADTGKVYIFGGSMGGTGTWNMLSNHPDFFAAGCRQSYGTGCRSRFAYASLHRDGYCRQSHEDIQCGSVLEEYGCV